MKTALTIAVVMGVLSTAAGAQQEKKAVTAGGGPPPSSNYVWVTINGTAGFNLNSVMIRNTDSTAVLNGSGAPVALTGASYGFNQPYDIVGSIIHHRVFVSNQGNGTVSVVDSDTLQPLAVVTLPGCTTAHGMSLSEDESAIFVAGGDANGPAVWQIDTTALTAGAAPIGGVADATHIAEDCVVIRAGNAGGTGNGPGKVYFSVQASGTLTALPGYIGVIHLNPAGAFTSIPTQAGALASVGTPINMERTADSRFVFAGCSKVTGFASDVRIIRIDPLTDTATAPVVIAAGNDVATNRVMDVSWTVGAGGVNRGMVLEFNQTALSIVEIDETGAALPTTLLPAAGGGLTSPLTVRFTPLSKQVFVGDDIGTNNGYARYDASGTPVVLGTPQITGVGSRCLNFAVMPTPAVQVFDICPRAGLRGASIPVTVHGTGFTPTGTYNFGTGVKPIGAGFIDSNTFMADFGGGAGLLGVTVANIQNFQAGSMDLFFNAYAAPEQRPAFSVPLPPASQGYQMLSIPQYSSVTALRAAFSAALGPYNPVLYRVFFYRNGQYVELNNLADDGCDLAGESFWVLTRNGATLTMTEPDVRSNDGGTNRVIPINPGFNLISLPTLNGAGPGGSINWANVQVSATSTNLTSGLLAANAAPAVLTPVALEYVNGRYVTADPLVAGRGYWVENVSGNPAYLVFARLSVFTPIFLGGGAAPPAGMDPPPPPSVLGSGSSNGSGGSGGCGLSGLEWLLPLLGLRFVARRRRLPA